MPAIASIVLNDGKATPVAHTFAPKAQRGESSLFEDRSVGIPAAFSKISTMVKESAQMRRVSTFITIPTLKAVAGVNSGGFTPAAEVAYALRVKVEFELPMLCTSDERKDLKAYLQNLLADANYTEVIVNNDDYYG